MLSSLDGLQEPVLLTVLAVMSYTIRQQLWHIGQDFKKLYRPTPPFLSGGAAAEACVDTFTARACSVWTHLSGAWLALRAASWALFYLGATSVDVFKVYMTTVLLHDSGLEDTALWAFWRSVDASVTSAGLVFESQCTPCAEWSECNRAFVEFVTTLLTLAITGVTDLALFVATWPCRQLGGCAAAPPACLAPPLG